MATQLQIRRGTTAQMNAFTGAEGEIAVNTSTDTVHVHDGATAGGFALAKADGSNIGTYAGSFTTISASGAITGNVTGNLTGSVLTAAQTNITSVGTLSTLAVTGTATTGGLTVDGNARIEEIGAIAKLTLERGGTANATDSAAVDMLETNSGTEGANFGDAGTNGFRLKLDGSANDFLIQSGAATTITTRFGIDRDSGDISFYNAAGNSQSLFWDSSAESLGIGTSSINSNAALEVHGGQLRVASSSASSMFAVATSTTYSDGVTLFSSYNGSGAYGPMIFDVNGERMRIDSSGNITQTGANSADFLIKAPTDNASLTLQAGASDSGAEGAFVNFLQNTTYKWQMGMDTDNGFRWYNYAASSEAMRIDSSGNLLVAGSATPTWVGTGPGVSLQGTYPVIGWEPTGGDKHIIYAANDNQVFYNATDTRADGFIDGTGILHWQSQYTNTTANAANCWVGTTGYIHRSTSSIKYKRDVETMEDTYADAILDVRPVFYRSTSDEDDQSHGYWGIIAEELAEIDPRLVHWTTDKTVIDEPAVYKDVDGVSTLVVPETYKQVLLDTPEPEGVQYERFIPHLINLAKRQRDQITAQATAITDLTTRLTALENN